MNAFFRPLVISLLLIFGLSACSSDTGVSSTGSGSLASDGGADSAQYAGTYKGSTDVQYTGDGIDSDDSFPTTVVIKTNGTTSLTIEGETVEGVISGNKLEFPFRLTKSENGIECVADVVIKASVDGNKITGPATGDAECKLLLIKRSAAMTGSINVTKS